MFEPVYLKSNLEGRKLEKAIGKLSGLSQEQLAEIALKAPTLQIQRAALDRLIDHKALAEFAKQTKNEGLCASAMEKLTDAERLAVIREARDSKVKEIAAKGLSNYNLLDIGTYSALPDYMREKAIKGISDEGLLAFIIQSDNWAPNRLAALKKTTDERVALAALKDPNEDVRAEAVFHVHDNEVLARYLSNYGKTNYSRREELYRIIDGFSEAQLKMLLNGNIRDSLGDIKRYVCGKLGHQPGKKCVCAICKSRMPHVFDADGVCLNCGAKHCTKRVPLKIMGEAYGYRDDVILAYPDGTEETLSKGSETVTADEGKMKWLMSDY